MRGMPSWTPRGCRMSIMAARSSDTHYTLCMYVYPHTMHANSRLQCQPQTKKRNRRTLQRSERESQAKERWQLTVQEVISLEYIHKSTKKFTHSSYSHAPSCHLYCAWADQAVCHTVHDRALPPPLRLFSWARGARGASSDKIGTPYEQSGPMRRWHSPAVKNTFKAR